MLRRFPAILALIIGLSAAQLLPFFELVQHSHRGAEYAAGIWAMPAWGWANFIVPLFHCIQSDIGTFYQPDQYWTTSYYPGVGIVALAVLAFSRWREKRVWLLGTLALLSLILALGDRGYLYHWLRAVFPLGAMRFAIKFVLLAIFLLPLLAASAVSEQAPRTENSPANVVRWTATIWLCLVGLIGYLVWSAGQHPHQFEDPSATLQSGLTRAIFLTLILGAFLLLGRAKKAKRQLLWGMCLLLLVWADVMTHAPRQNPTVDSAIYAPGLPDLQRLDPKPTPGQSRALLSREALSRFYATGFSNLVATYYGQRLGLFANCNLLERIPKVDGFFSLYLREQRELHFQIYDENKQLHPHVADFLSACQVTSPTNVTAWEARPTYLPMITAGQKPVLRDPKNILNEMLAPGFDPEHEVYLPLAAQTTLTATNAAKARATLNEFTAHHLVLEVEAAQPTLVVISQAFYPAWKAYVDRKPTRLWQANHAFQALEVPAGRHAVRLAYEDHRFYVGAVVSAITLMACGIAWVRLRKPERTQATRH
ncbi:MAG: hypothetical protein DME26_12390 [Verrucomicrobia bacterium]|nr:MAG: hypothetical protein DME26_12390 [Verrucomicrobiota bacterium]